MLNGKTILVTGGGTGIGAATAASVVAKGGNAIVMARRGETVRAVADEIGQGCLAVTGDAGNGDDVARTVELAISEFGQLDGVIAAPGAMGPGAVGDLDDEAWRRLIHGNLDTCFVTAREALPALIASQGAIVFVSSVEGRAWKVR
ncbi:MAG: SDR family oxidoreductase, partial [Novosphingobium sp.]|nr:SDR family oxidoreductase [Novosphingobium sp.]